MFSCIIAKGLEALWVYFKNLVLFLWNSVKNPNCHVAFLQDISLQRVDNGIWFELSIFFGFWLTSDVYFLLEAERSMALYGHF